MNDRNNAKHMILTIVLAVLYVPLSLFGFLCFMATDGLIGETNTLVIVGTNIFAYTGLLMPLMAPLSLVGAHFLYSSGRKKSSYVVRFIPAFLFIVTALLLWGIEVFVG